MKLVNVYIQVFQTAQEAADDTMSILSMVTPCDESTNKVLLDPKGPLTKVLSSSAIKMVNDEVAKVYQKTSSSPDEPISNKRGKYLTLTPAQRFELGKRAAEHGVTSFQKKYPD